MQSQSLGLVEKKSLSLPSPLVLEGGDTLDRVTLAYETYGQLNHAKSNAILICHALSGDAHAAGFHQGSDKAGWWEIMVGPGKAIDTDRYFVICSNILGSCMGSTGPSSINPKSGKSYGLAFPVVTIGDMVNAQKALIDHLGITKLLSIIGGSIGGMQTLEWSIRYPEMVFSAIPLATTQRHSALAIAFNEVARQAIMADPNWRDGNYYGDKKPDMGLAVARMIGHITYLSDTAMRNKFGRRLQNKDTFSFNFGADFQVESYLRHQGNKFVNRFDANSFLYITKAADYFDLTTRQAVDHQSPFAKALARYLVVSFTSDWLYPTSKSKAMVKAMKKHNIDVSFCEIEAEWGHDAFLMPNPRLSDMLSGFLDRMNKEYHP
ncbi:MAG: homoserine O-acetyltransferase [Proteobacteria bacterium]|nr:homoserine O-acetyltransferase [Desulfobulbaceae bacterium]MBU4153042.1 homoserine O-acetyltransferase [Pseudomonadota bacterium]